MQKIEDFFFAVASSGTRTLPPLVVVGPHGCGKTHAVRFLGIKHLVEIVEISAAAPDHLVGGGSGSPLSSRESLGLWLSFVRVRSPSGRRRVLFIDDAESVIVPSSSLSLGDFVELGRHELPLLIAATDLFSNSLLRQFSSSLKVSRVSFPPASPFFIKSLLASKFPHASSSLISSVAVGANGDIRQALFNCAIEHQLHHSSAPSSCGRAGNVFDHLSALFGVAGSGLSPTDAECELALQKHSQIVPFIESTYASFASELDSPLDVIAASSALLSDFDLRKRTFSLDDDDDRDGLTLVEYGVGVLLPRTISEQRHKPFANLKQRFSGSLCPEKANQICAVDAANHLFNITAALADQKCYRSEGVPPSPFAEPPAAGAYLAENWARIRLLCLRHAALSKTNEKSVELLAARSQGLPSPKLVSGALKEVLSAQSAPWKAFDASKQGLLTEGAPLPKKPKR